ncbi:MAG: hydroxyphenylacetyl-CoA thioesterase PaaI [Acidimicrobiales bacterium]
MFEHDRAAAALGIEALEPTGELVRLQMRVTEQMLNAHGMAHGGYVFVLADTAFGCACNRDGSVTVAAGAAIDFVAPVRLGDVLVAEAIERSRSGRSGIYDVTVRAGGGDGEVVAEFRGRSRTVS